LQELKKNCYEILAELYDTACEHIKFYKAIKMSGYFTSKNCLYKFRIIESFDPETNKENVLLTKHHIRSPRAISVIYKD